MVIIVAAVDFSRVRERALKLRGIFGSTVKLSNNLLVGKLGLTLKICDAVTSGTEPDEVAMSRSWTRDRETKENDMSDEGKKTAFFVCRCLHSDWSGNGAVIGQIALSVALLILFPYSCSDLIPSAEYCESSCSFAFVQIIKIAIRCLAEALN